IGNIWIESPARWRLRCSRAQVRFSEGGVMIERLRARSEWTFFGVLPQADRTLAVAWWALLVLRGILPALFAIAIGTLVGAVQRGGVLFPPLALVGVVFLLLQVLPPIHQAIGALLGSRTAAWLYDRLTAACVGPPGMGHLEDPKLTSDLTMARDFDLGITGPPMFISMDFIASGLVEMVAGLASTVVLCGYAWWAPLLLAGAWLATHWLLRESGGWRGRSPGEVRKGPGQGGGRAPRGGRAASGQGAAALRAGELGRGSLPRAAPAALRAPVAGDPPARAAHGRQPAAGGRRQSHRVLVPGQ